MAREFRDFCQISYSLSWLNAHQMATSATERLAQLSHHYDTFKHAFEHTGGEKNIGLRGQFVFFFIFS